jgi:hypothetical protein
MAKMNGVVEQVSTKDVTTKFGVKPTFSFKVSGTWVKHGFKNPKVNVGDEVEFDGESGTYGLEGKNVVVTKAGVGVPSSTATATAVRSAPPAYSARVFPIPPLHGDRSIIRQNALARSVDLFIAARGGKPFDCDESSTKVIIHLARQFEAYTAGDIDLAEATAESKVAIEKGE